MRLGLSFVVAAVSFLLLVACGDDDSDFATRPPEGPSSSSVIQQSSSSVKSSSSVASSSSEKAVSSSSKVSVPVEVTTGTMTDSRDGQMYKTVTIGTQTWMAENLNYETENSYCYKDNASKCTKYGRLYTWAAAVTACPSGWHLPTNAEFETLFTAVGGQSTAGKMLKSTTGWAAYSGITNEDAFAFSALPAGYRYYYGYYYFEGSNAYFWSSTESNRSYAYSVCLYYNNDNAYLGNGGKGYGFSVRCLQD